ncbi:DNA gyrase subunit A [Ethanoligenens harbinense]|uniref:DNA gyrase subunit A n=1 Tax=Ethanoligenens harbinense (strain DSM 18485 / JCM 12961 / CGMCC 1.5033 / YUAN-3) TaxID=663278 RepID=E6U5D1_ETHHY|nr:DNA gyrase subunit A [Ethanoligenens harbinense]ADU25598.1 DNA gyrase, A subunit [Ethanoligenens harbinense YUAN-3]AVQ94776.1 DNA gyrase subunit A [Ethanoligenens harbinense YUAN-3]AYF37468.1 DNA gyrase subunit A [Ethanoligenens harbinense]AYF40188.1 DNA gyrase subunit A [Ethanoligenens harbinense]QCN91021.1 DNA gyrase subunit A [Ethanoligenens harbinense]
MNFDGQKLIPVEIREEMEKSFLEYSMSVIVSRALPDVRDGLKPVHRRILYAMYEDNLLPTNAYRKSATTVGNVLGRYHPHGDASVYDALVRMAQSFSLRYPLVDGHGNFGSIDGDGPAAYRYTEARMSRISLEMLQDIEKETVDFQPNFDDVRKEPIVIPSRFPNILVNGSSGIAVGMATNIPPHNLGEVIDGMALLIDNPDATLEELTAHIQGPDFPTGGIIMGRAGIREAYVKGRSRITLRAKATIEEDDNGRSRIIVTEIPYMVSKARIVEGIAELHKEKRIEGISDLRDESDREGLRIVVELKRDANPQVVLNRLYTYSQLQETVPVIMLALVNGHPRVLPLRDILTEYIHFQEQVVTRRTQYDLRKAEERAHILEGLKIALDFIDEVIRILRASKSIPEGKAALMERFELDDIQAQAIVQMRLGQLTNLEREKIEEELAALETKIANFKAILADEQRILQIVKEEALEVKAKFGDERRTRIENVSGEVDVEDLIPVEDVVLTLTNFGYIKRLPAAAYHSQRRGGRGVNGLTRREEDVARELFVCSTHDFVLFFTSHGRCYRLKGYEVPEGSRTSKGMNVANILPVAQDENITAMIKVPKFEEDCYLVMVTKKGIVKRTSLKEYDTARKAGVIGILLEEDDELVGVLLTDGSAHILVGTRNGVAIRFVETDARPMGRAAHGVKAISLEGGDYVVGVTVPNGAGSLLLITENGYGKRVPFEDFRVQNRGGKGLTSYNINEKTGPVAGLRVVEESDDALFISSDGVVIRVPVAEIPVYSRYAQGVRVMRVGEETKVVTVTSAAHEEESEEESETSPEDAEQPETETAENSEKPDGGSTDNKPQS